MRSAPQIRSRAWRLHLSAVVLFSVAAVVMTWPTARCAGTHLADTGDAVADCWILAWGADHILRLDFRSFLDGNIFYPSPRTLTYDDMLLAWQPVVVPIYWGTGNILLARNITFLLSTVLAGYGMFLLARHLTGSAAAALSSTPTSSKH